MPTSNHILEIRNQSKYFHSIKKGCEIVKKKLIQKKKIQTCLFCETHQKEICKCGWEFGHHFDVKS